VYVNSCGGFYRLFFYTHKIPYYFDYAFCVFGADYLLCVYLYTVEKEVRSKGSEGLGVRGEE